MIPTANKHPNSLLWPLRKGSDNLTHHIFPSYLKLHLPKPRTTDTQMSCYHSSELLWDHTLHSPIPCFCGCAIYLEGISPLPSLVQNLLPPKSSPLQFLKKKSNCTPTWIFSHTAFLRQILPCMTFICVPLTELLGLSFWRARTASYPPLCSPQLQSTYSEWNIWIFNVGA